MSGESKRTFTVFVRERDGSLTPHVVQAPTGGVAARLVGDATGLPVVKVEVVK
jgi:hypothetical protein